MLNNAPLSRAMLSTWKGGDGEWDATGDIYGVGNTRISGNPNVFRGASDVWEVGFCASDCSCTIHLLFVHRLLTLIYRLSTVHLPLLSYS